MMKLQNFSKTEKLMLRMLGKLQNEVDVMKDDIAFIKDCWIESAQRDSGDPYGRDMDQDEEEETDHTDLEEEHVHERDRGRDRRKGRDRRSRRSKEREKGRSHRGHHEDEEEEDSASYITDSRSY